MEAFGFHYLFDVGKSMKQQLEEILNQARAQVGEADTERSLGELKAQILGRKGSITALMKTLAGCSPEERPVMGKLINDAKSALEELFEARAQEVRALDVKRRLEAERLDVTLPGRRGLWLYHELQLQQPAPGAGDHGPGRKNDDSTAA